MNKSYMQFSLTTLQLPAPSSNLTKAEYKDKYGIDLDSIDISSFKLVVYGNDKYPIDQIKAIEGGYEIYFNGRVLSITDIVQTSEEVYSVENAKPIYIHPININKGADNAQGGRFTLFIFNNSSSPIDTIAKLEAEILRIYEMAGATVRILVNGGFYDSDNSRMIVANFIGYGLNQYYLSGVDTTGYTRVFTNASLNALLGTPEQINDGVNKLN